MAERTDSQLEAQAEAMRAAVLANSITKNMVSDLFSDIIDSKPNNPLRGNYDASVNTFPASGGTGTSGAVLRGNMFTVTVAGTINGEFVPIGTVLMALTDSPGQTESNWRRI